MQKRTAFKLCLAGATAVALNAAPVAVFAKDEPLKVAFVYVSPANVRRREVRRQDQGDLDREHP